MSTKHIILAAALFTASGALNGAAFAANQANNGATRQPGEGFLVRRMEKQLGITAAQHQQILQILRNDAPRIQAAMDRAAEQTSEMRSSETGTFDEQRVRSIALAHQNTTVDLIVERERLRYEIVQVLTAEQRQKLDNMRLQRRGELLSRLSSIGDAP